MAKNKLLLLLTTVDNFKLAIIFVLL